VSVKKQIVSIHFKEEEEEEKEEEEEEEEEERIRGYIYIH
jgi:hypothetical protein